MPRADLVRSLALVSSSFPKTVLQGAQAWLLAQTPQEPPIPRDRVCLPARRGRSSPASAIWAKSPATGQDRPPWAEPQSRLGRPVGPGRLAHLGGWPAPSSPPPHSQLSLPRGEGSGGSRRAPLPASRLAPWARHQARPTPELRGKGRLGLALGGKKAQRRRLLWASSASGGRGGTTPRGSGPGDGAMWGRAAAGAADPGLWGGTRSAAPISGTARGPGKRR